MQGETNKRETNKFELTEKEVKNLTYFLSEGVVFTGNRKQVIPQMRELDRLLLIFNPQSKRPIPGKIQEKQKNADKKD